jgi:hypothetical protein
MSASGHENQNFCLKKCFERTWAAIKIVEAANVTNFGLIVVGSQGLGELKSSFWKVPVTGLLMGLSVRC